MRQAAFLLVVATLLPEVTTTTFRLSNHLAFVVRGGADKGRLDVIHPSTISKTADAGEQVDRDETKTNDDLDVDNHEVKDSGNNGDDDAEKNEIECVGDACTVRGGADVPESTESPDLANDDGDKSPIDGDSQDEAANKKDDEEDSGGDSGESGVDATTVRGGADEPESTEAPDSTEDYDGEKSSIEGDIEEEAADKNDEENSGGNSGENVVDATSVRGGADEPESTEAPDSTADEGGDKSSIEGDVEEETADKNDEQDSGGDNGESVVDSTSVRGGADEPESPEAPDASEDNGGDKSSIDGDVEDEAADKNDDEEDFGGDNGEATSVRGGADVPDTTQSHDPKQGEGNGNPPIDGEIEEEAVENNDDKETKVEEGESLSDATSVRGGAKEVADAQDFAEEDEYEYENDEGELEVEGEEGQYDGVEVGEEDAFYEEEDEFGMSETADVIQKDVILIDDETEEFQDEHPVIEVGPEFVHQHATDDDSSAFVDRDELADAYDDDEAIVGATSFRAGHTDDHDRASIDDVPGTDESTGTQSESRDDADVVEQETGENADDANALEPALSAITKEVEQILINECGFRKAELRGMKPQIANLMAEKRLRRPQEGIPDSWYDEKKKGLVLATVARVLSAVIPLALGAFVIFGDIDVMKLLDGLRKSELLIGVEEEKKRKDDSELTIPGTETEDDFEEKIVEEPEPMPSNKNRMFRFRRSGAQVPTNK
jgi:hypothetical protein